MTIPPPPPPQHPVADALLALTTQVGRIADAMAAPLPGETRAVQGLADAIRLTREYVGAELLPAVEGWSWYDALRRWAPEFLPGQLAPVASVDVAAAMTGDTDDAGPRCTPACSEGHTYAASCTLCCAPIAGGTADQSWSVRCPQCAAQPGQPCRRPDGTALAALDGPKTAAEEQCCGGGPRGNCPCMHPADITAAADDAPHHGGPIGWQDPNA